MISNSSQNKQFFGNMFDEIHNKDKEQLKKLTKDIRSLIETERAQLNRTNFTLMIDLLNNKLIELINSPNENGRIAAVLIIDKLIDVQEEESALKIARFSSHLKSLLLRPNNGFALIQLIAKTLGHLIKFGGALQLTSAEIEIQRALEWLDAERNEVQFMTALCVFSEFSKAVPNVVYQNSSRFLDLIWIPLRDPKIAIREAAINSLAACLNLLKIRQNKQEKKIYANLFLEAQKTIQLNKPELVHGGLLVICEIFQNQDNYLDNYFKDACNLVFRYTSSKISMIRPVLVKIIPLLAKYSPDFFRANYLNEGLNYLLNTLKQGRSLLKETFSSLSDLIVIAGKHIQEFVPKIMSQIQKSMIPSQKVKYCETSLICLATLSKVTNIEPYLLRSDILNVIFSTGLDKTKIFVFSELLNTLSNLKVHLKFRILNIFSLILSDTKYQVPHFIYTDLLITPSKNYMDKGQKLTQKDIIEASTKSWSSQILFALKGLREFSFDEEVQKEYLEINIVPYFRNSNSKIRREAGLTSIKLLSSPNFDSDPTIYNIIQSLISLAVTDQDPSNRLAILQELFDKFHHKLFDPENVELLSLSLNDENIEVRKLSITIIGKIGEISPSIVLPTLRNTLMGLLTEFEISQSRIIRDQSVELLVHLVQYSNKLIRPYCDSMMQSFLSKIENLSDDNQEVTSYVLSAIGNIIEVGGEKMGKYQEDLLPVLAHYMIDQNPTFCLSALQTMGKLVQFTGFVISPFKKYPDLIQSLLRFVRSVNDPQIQQEAVRVIGLIGAIDPEQHRKALSKDEEDQEAKTEKLNEAKPSLFSVKSPKTNNSQHTATLSTRTRDTQSDISLQRSDSRVMLSSGVRPLTRRRRGENTFTESYGGRDQHTDPQYEQFYYQQGKGQEENEDGDQDEDEEKRMNRREVVSGIAEYFMNPERMSQEEFFANAATSTLMRILEDRALRQHHRLAIQAFVLIVHNFADPSAVFLKRILRPFFQHMQICSSVSVQFIFEKMSLLVSSIKQNMKIHIASIMRFLFANWIPFAIPQIVGLIEEIAEIFPDQIKTYMPTLVPRLVAAINKLRTFETQEVMHCLRLLGDKLCDYLPLVVPAMLDLAEDRETQESLRVEAVKTLGKLCASTNLTDQSSRIMQALIRVLETPSNVLRKSVLDTMTQLAVQLGHRYRVFLPVVGETLRRYRILGDVTHVLYEEVSRAIETGEQLPSLTLLKKRMRKRSRSRRLLDVVSHSAQKTPQSFQAEHIAKFWNTRGCETEDDWREWMKRFSSELLRHSPSVSLRSCEMLLGTATSIEKTLFEVAFLRVFTYLPDEHKRDLIRNIESVMRNLTTVPVEIQQMILGLDDFMSHAGVVFGLDVRILGNAAERCSAYAKALRYKELELSRHLNDPRWFEMIDSVISVASKLQQRDTIRGVIRFGEKRISAPNPKQRWFEELNQWEDALRIYTQRRVRKPESLPDILGQMRCLFSLGKWHTLLELSEEACKIADQDSTSVIAEISANAAWIIGDWRKMQFHTNKISEKSWEGTFLRAVLALHNGDLEEAGLRLVTSRQSIVDSISALGPAEYRSVYPEIVKAHQVSELEEVLYLAQSHVLANSANTCANDFPIVDHYSPSESRELIKKTWKNRLKGAEPSTDVWLKIMLVHSLVFSRQESASLWLRFVNMCDKNGNHTLASQTIRSFLVDISGNNKREFSGDDFIDNKSGQNEVYDLKVKSSPFIQRKFTTSNQKDPLGKEMEETIFLQTHPRAYFKYLTHLWACNKRESALAKLKKFISEFMDILLTSKMKFDFDPNKLKAKAFLSFGMWNLEIQEDSHDQQRNPENSSKMEILSSFYYATKYAPKWARAWHFWALMNFETVSEIMQKEGRLETGQTRKHLIPAITGFFRAISLSSSRKIIRDTLRILTLWFRHGSLKEVNAAMRTGFDTVSIDIWLQVIPQIIARITTPSDLVKNLIRHLLNEIGKAHPQALVYPLIVSEKCQAINATFHHGSPSALDPLGPVFSHNAHTSLSDPDFQSNSNSAYLDSESLATFSSSFENTSSLSSDTSSMLGENEQNSPPNQIIQPFNFRSKTQDFANDSRPQNFPKKTQFESDSSPLFTSENSNSPPRNIIGYRAPNKSNKSNKSNKNDQADDHRQQSTKSVNTRGRSSLRGRESDKKRQLQKDSRKTKKRSSFTTDQINHRQIPTRRADRIHHEKNRPENIAKEIMEMIRSHSPVLVEDTRMVSSELIRIAILWKELWHEAIEEVSRQYFPTKNYPEIVVALDQMHKLMMRGPETKSEQEFVEAYRADLQNARQNSEQYMLTHLDSCFVAAWKSYVRIFKRLENEIPQMAKLELSNVSPQSSQAKNLELSVPGTYKSGSPIIYIDSISPNLTILKTKQRPRKLHIHGSDGSVFSFLLKGHEDLRQDERAMQLFGLINSLLLGDIHTAKLRLHIERYAVVPLSPNTGLIGWVPFCDTLYDLIREYRASFGIVLNLEHRMILQLTQNYDIMPLSRKLEIFNNVLSQTDGIDIQRVLWLKSQNTEVWLDKRTTYTRSLAVMSMVGYILGLGDRHPSNIMMDRSSGKIVHIDFGDCFEVAMHRKHFPETIPFRLTRMLVNAMEICGVDGTFTETSTRVMEILRTNKDSLMAMLEAFVYDPLFSWKLVGNHNANPNSKSLKTPLNPKNTPDDPLLSLTSLPYSNEVLNETALQVVTRISNKLSGRDFDPSHVMQSSNQVQRLIDQATSHKNLCQCYIGWCPYW